MSRSMTMPNRNDGSNPNYLPLPSVEIAALRARVVELEAALGSLYALVKGESPQLLEDDHHDEIVRSALNRM
jgi:hypothetical protein